MQIRMQILILYILRLQLTLTIIKDPFLILFLSTNLIIIVKKHFFHKDISELFHQLTNLPFCYTFYYILIREFIISNSMLNIVK